MNIMKLTRNRLIISLSILIVLIVATGYLNFMVSNNVSDVIEYKNNTNNAGITFDELNKVKKQYGELKLTGYKENMASVTNKYGVSPQKEIKIVQCCRRWI